MSYLSRRRAALMAEGSPVPIGQLIYSYDFEMPILVPTAIDSSGSAVVITVVNCPNTVSEQNAVSSLIKPTSSNTSGYPKRAFSILRVDDTHISTTDTYAFGGTVTAGNFNLCLRKVLGDNDALNNLLQSQKDYEFHTHGYIATNDKSAVRLIFGGFQIVTLKTANQNSQIDLNVITDFCCKFSIDLNNKIITVKKVTCSGYKNNWNNTITFNSYTFDDSTNVSFTATTARIGVEVLGSGDATVRLYKTTT